MAEHLQQAQANLDDQGTIRSAFGCGEALAKIIEGLGRAHASIAGTILYPRSSSEETVLLLSGEAHEIAYSRDGTPLVLHRLNAGEFYGALMALEALNPALIEALTPTRGAHFEQGTLIRLMESYSCVSLAITMQLARRLEAMRRRMVETVLLTATGRICAELARLARMSSDHVIRPIPVFSQLAVNAQTTRETVSRTVSLLLKRGVFKRVEDGLLLAAPHRLDDMIY